MSDDDKELLKYYIDQTNQRLDRLDTKVDELLSFKWQIVGGSVVLSVIINFLIERIKT